MMDFSSGLATSTSSGSSKGVIPNFFSAVSKAFASRSLFDICETFVRSMISGLKISLAMRILVRCLLVSVHDDIEGHAIAPIGGEIVDIGVVAFHVLSRPLQQRFFRCQPLLRVVAFNDNLFNL